MKRTLFLLPALSLLLLLPCAAYDMGAPGSSPRLSAGLTHTVYVDEAGGLWAWGSNQAGQLGLETQETGADPQGDAVPLSGKPMRVMDNVRSASAGADFTLALKTDGTLWAWGGNDYGQLGTGSTEAALQPVQILDQVAAISAGDYHAAALGTDGTLWTWGDNLFGQLGDGTLNSRTSPAPVLDQVTAVSAGVGATAALRSDGTLWTWGDNLFGQLGDGTLDSRPLPRQVLDEIAAVSMGGYHAVALGTDGSLWTWGSGIDGQLGLGLLGEDTAPQPTPAQVFLSLPATAISAGASHTAAVLADGSLWTWGRNASRQLGQGDAAATPLPSPVPQAAGVVAVSTGTYHTVCLQTDGALITWGPKNLSGGGAAEAMAGTASAAAATQAVFPTGGPPWTPLAVLAGSTALMLLLGLLFRNRRAES